MAVPTVYRWDDANAPQITNVHDWTQIKDWFDKIFVTGYLEDDNVTMKPPLGWNVTVDDGLFQILLDMVGDANIENLMRIRCQFDEQVGSGHYACKVAVWEHAYTNLIANAAGGSQPFIGQNDDDLKITQWIIIGTSRGFWSLSGHNSTVSAPTVPTDFTTSSNYVNFKYYGNFVNDGVNLGKNNQCALHGYGNLDFTALSSITTFQQYYYAANNYGVWMCRNYLNNYVTANDDQVHEEYLMSGANNNTFLGVYTYGLKYPYIDGGLYIKPFRMYNKNHGVYLGRMAGLYYPQQSRPLYHNLNLVEFTGEGIYAGQEFIGLSIGGASEFYINISEDWDI